MAFYIQNIKGKLHCDIIIFCKNTSGPNQHHDLGTEGEARLYRSFVLPSKT